MRAFHKGLLLGLIVGIGLMAHKVYSSNAPRLVSVGSSALNGKPLSPVGSGSDVHVSVIEGTASRYVAVPCYESADKLLKTSVKRYEKVTLDLRDWPVDEVMHFVSGKVEIIDAEGRSSTYGPGDTMVMPKGFSGRWRQLDTIEMITIEYGDWR
jgi:hypothetical protein